MKTFLSDQPGPENPQIFTGSVEYESLMSLVEEFTGDEGSAQMRWTEIASEFESWERSVVGRTSSPLSHKLYFLKLLFGAFPLLQTDANERIAEIVVPDSMRISRTVAVQQPDGKVADVVIVGREITTRGGILLTLESQDGTRFTHEYLD